MTELLPPPTVRLRGRSEPVSGHLRRPLNPYVLTPLTDGVGFFGRDAVLHFVRNTLTAPYQNVIVLFGQRRIGKTSVLHQLMRPQQTPTDFRPVYFDLQGRAEHRLDQVLYGLAREIARALKIAPPVREAFLEDTYFQYGFLPQVYQVMHGERLLILVDEFDVLGGEEVTPDAAVHNLFSYLQDLLLDEQKHLAFVFVVGRRLDELPSRIKATFKSAQCKRISVLDRPAAERLITEPAAGVIRFTDDAVTALLDITTGHPYFLQLLCYELFERVTRAKQRVVTAADVNDDLLTAAMELGMGGLAWFWDEFPPAERFILSAIAHITQFAPVATLRQIGDTLREHGVRLQGMEMSTAPSVLADWEIIERAGRDAFRFRVPFIRRWILTKHTLDEAKRELEQVSLRAVRLYESARRMHGEGDLVAAVAEYGRAVAANPNHARARLGHAQALFEVGRLEAAVDAFEKAFRLDPESARDGLLSAHRDMGSALENEGHFDQARPHFLRMLDVNPEDATANLRLRDSWRATAGAHLAAGLWDKAIEAYREALRYVPDDAYLRKAVTTLEQRHLESEALQRRREQLERAVLENRLKDELDHRERIQHEVHGVLQVVFAASATAALLGMVAIATSARALDDTVWLLVIGAVLTMVYAAYHWASRKLS